MVLIIKSIKEYYNVGKTLGKGTFGDVHSAEIKTRPNDIVALKTLRNSATPPDAKSNESLENLREVIFFRNVGSHANIIELHDMFQDSESKNVVFALEYMRGNVFQLIEYHRKRSEKDGLDTLMVAKIVKDVLKGLEHIHSCGFAHRDIKPENILWSGQGRHLVVKLADFGLSRFVTSNSSRPWTGYVATRWYRSPEQLLNLRDHTTAVDIWSTSLILYEVCNFAPLFPGRTTTDMIEKQLEALGIPSRDAVGGPSKTMFSALEQLYGQGIREEAALFRGFIVTPEWLRWENHECFTETLIAGLQWEPSSRPTATQMLNMLRYALHNYQKQRIARGLPLAKRSHSA